MTTTLLGSDHKHPQEGKGEALVPGTLLAERYRIDRRLGQGGMGTVYLAEHVRVGRKVAVKVLGAEWVGHPQVPRRFRDEARAASAAGHPNIIEVFDAGELSDGRPYLVMEYLEGRELFSLISEHGRLAVDAVCRYGRDVAMALGAAHDRGVIHRDLKSENVMIVERAGSTIVKVLDFGIAAVEGDTNRPTTALGQVMGTPAYMAPEQARGARATVAVDIYALGVLLHEALTGKVPFDPLGPHAMLAAKIGGPAPSVATVRDDLPTGVVELVDACLALEPGDRPATVREIAERLDALQRTPASTVFAPATAPAQPSSSTPSRRWLLPVLALVVVSVGTILAFNWSRDGDTPSPTTDPSGALGAVVPTSPASMASTGELRGEGSDGSSTSGGDSSTSEMTEELDASTTGGATPVAGPPSRKRPRPRPTTPPAPEAKEPPANDGTCWRTRKQAKQARQMHDWSGVLKHTRTRSCWADAKGERLRLRTKAQMELGQWEACMRTGQSLRDAEAERWVALCRRRKEQG